MFSYKRRESNLTPSSRVYAYVHYTCTQPSTLCEDKRAAALNCQEESKQKIDSEVREGDGGKVEGLLTGMCLLFPLRG